MKNNRILLDAGAGDGGAGGGGAGGAGGAADWRLGIPEDIRINHALKDIKDVGSLAKSYVHAQQLIGTNRIPQPQANWKDEQWNDFYQKIGRPEKPEDYKLEDGVIPDTMKDQVDEAKMLDVKKQLHAAGLTPKQTNAVLKYYFGTMDGNAKSLQASRQAEIQQSTEALRKEWGQDYESKLEIAKATLGQLGSKELIAELETSGMGNNPHLIKMLARVGEGMLEDGARGTGDGLIVTDSTKALQEIEALKADRDFMTAWSSREHQGHAAAVARWSRLHEVAYKN